jgi:flagellar hook-length control protein FliK
VLNQADTTAQTDANAQASATIVTTHSDGPTGTGSADGTGSTGQAAATGAKVATNDVPTLGIAAANVAAPLAATTPSTAATAPTVSISGLPVAIASRAQSGSSQFDIRLDPPELGRIEVRLDVDSSGQVTSHITADRQDTLNLLQNQQPQLERALEQAGLKTSDNGMQFSLRDQSFTGQQNQNFAQNGNGSPSTAAQLVIPDSSLPAVDTTQIYSRLNLRGGLDIRV